MQGPLDPAWCRACASYQAWEWRPRAPVRMDFSSQQVPHGAKLAVEASSFYEQGGYFRATAVL